MGNVGTIPITIVDRGRGDPMNIMSIIIDVYEHYNYTIALDNFIVLSEVHRNRFDL